jgi:hypothetical protein
MGYLENSASYDKDAFAHFTKYCKTQTKRLLFPIMARDNVAAMRGYAEIGGISTKNYEALFADAQTANAAQIIAFLIEYRDERFSQADFDKKSAANIKKAPNPLAAAELKKLWAAPEDCTVGTAVKFGGYDWLVLEKEAGKALLITAESIAKKSYSKKESGVNWKTSYLRKWLNGEFYNQFTDGEKSLITETSLPNPDEDFDPFVNHNTSDKVFLLSVDEVGKYFPDKKSLVDVFGYNRGTWLRSGDGQSFTASGIWSGRLYGLGDNMASMLAEFRPVLYISLEA